MANSRINVEYFRFEGEPIAPFSQGITEAAITPTQKSMGGENAFSDVADGVVVLHLSGHVVVRNVCNSVFATETWPSSMHLEGLRNSVFVIHCTGPVFIHDVENCVLVLKCHQLRLHNATGSAVFVEVSNDRVIIEKCRGLTLGAYSYDNKTLGPSLSLQVDDFDWPTKMKASPNYGYWKGSTFRSGVPNALDDTSLRGLQARFRAEGWLCE